MKNHQNGFVAVWLWGAITIVIAIVIIASGIYYYNTRNINSVQNSALSTYDNFGIYFQYPVEWEIPDESFYGNGLGLVFFDHYAADTQWLSLFIEQDTNPQGTGLLNETLDQMVARFRANNKYIYQAKDISADGVQGKELFYNNAVTGQPYHVDAYFPFQNGSYVTLGADYQSVSQATFDSVISTLKWDSATAFKQDQATEMAIYHNNGIRFEYPVKLNTDYASLVVKTSVVKVDSTKLDSFDCYPGMNDSGRPSSSSVLTVGGIKFCTTTSGDVGAGQKNTTYSYMTLRNGNVYTVEYSVGTSNGCGAYQNSPKYNACMDFTKNYDSIVTKPIQQSISTFSFTN